MSKPIKIGVVGLGRIGMTNHKRCLEERPDKYEVVAACDLIEDRCQQFADTFGCRTYTNIEDLIADPEVEVVDIATRSCDHYIHAKMALLAGKSVLVEKPFCRTYEEAKELVELGSQPAGPKVFVRHNRRLEEGFLQVNEIINSGILGDVYEIRLARNSYQRRNDWQTIKEFGGGQLLNWGPHIVDHAIQFCGGAYEKMFSEIRRVTAVGDAEDHIKLVFKGVNGRIVDMEISGGVALKVPEYLVYGTKGTLKIEGKTMTLKYLNPAVELKDIKADPATPGSGSAFGNSETLEWIEETRPTSDGKTEAIWDCFYEAYRNNKPYPVTSAQAIEVVRTLELAKKGTEFEK
ncbi:MAG: Gfo/Idh/MocA family oxidoreductase [Clostridia bacterium]|nr:Gfo/Idh/MocA family oxidoreductase [Clostridia bacterium]MBQ9785693.1 Gfo/Idh/MocA family oxidoreductase [Clostridia bacterium]